MLEWSLFVWGLRSQPILLCFRTGFPANHVIHIPLYLFLRLIAASCHVFRKVLHFEIEVVHLVNGLADYILDIKDT